MNKYDKLYTYANRHKDKLTEDDIRLVNLLQFKNQYEIARIFNTRQSTISYRIKSIWRKLGLEKERKTTWTKEEVEYLKNNWCRVDLNKIISKIGRTRNSVIRKAARLNLGNQTEARCLEDDSLLVTDIIEILGVYRDNVRKWYKYGFPSYYIETTTKYELIKINKWLEWLKNHQDLVNLKNTEKDCFCYNEPKWLTEKRKKDIAENKTANNYTEEETQKLKQLLREYKYSAPELSKIFRRTESGIRSKITRLKLKARPTPDSRKPWTTEESEILINLVKQKMSYDKIAKMMNRSESSVRNKYKKLMVK